MKKYKQNSMLLTGVIGSLLLLGGCGGLPKTDKITNPTLQVDKQQTSFNDTNKLARRIPTSVKVTTPTHKSQPATKQGASITRANQLMRSGQKTAAADMYYRSAFSYPSPQRERVMLQAAEISASTGDNTQTTRYLQAATRGRLTPLNQIRYRYIQSLLALNKQQPTQALQLLPPVSSNLPKGLHDKIELVRRHAKAQISQANQVSSPDIQTTAQQDSIRRPLVATKPTVGYQSAPVNHNTDTPLEERPLIQAEQTNAQVHALPQSTNKIAILLPNTGALAKVGNEIYQGIQDAQAIYGNDVLIKRYATNQGNVLNRYQQAVSDGADIVIGPLNKTSLNTLAIQPELLQIPILSLNYLPDSSINLPHTLYQFGLSPEDEVKQIIELAIKRGQMNSVVMVPDSAWGKRLGDAFTKHYQQRGGTVLHVATYPQSAGSSYLKRVQSLPGGAEGADMFFLAASPTQARLLHPLLKAQVGLLPVYATSHIFSGISASNKDIDLDGIIYTEIPYILKKSKQGSLDKLKFPRLYALGMDSLMIARNLAPLVQHQTLGGQTGQIRMSEARRMQRKLEFATFINGQPHNLQP